MDVSYREVLAILILFVVILLASPELAWSHKVSDQRAIPIQSLDQGSGAAI
jgi:hypothetical protein